jgi:hypothetical protein
MGDPRSSARSNLPHQVPDLAIGHPDQGAGFLLPQLPLHHPANDLQPFMFLLGQRD